MLTSFATLDFGCAAPRPGRAVSARVQAHGFAAEQSTETAPTNRASAHPERALGRGDSARGAVLPRQFDTLVERAREARKHAYVPAPEISLPSTLTDIDWASYRTIRFRPERALWREEPGQFEAQFFHLGFIYRTPVDIFEVRDERTERLPFSVDQFRYDAVPSPAPNLPLGYAGMRLHTNLNSNGYRDETIVFQGASYFRSLGRGNAFGLSARAPAIDTGEQTPEEFPRFSELYLVKPAAEERSIWVLAMLDSARVTGACAFRITPGEQTRVEVTEQLFFREPVHVLGLAPFSSMHLFGEARLGFAGARTRALRHRSNDERPEVHDSDHLALFARGGERLARPLDNPARTRVTHYRLDSPRGFGLLQRDRAADSYRDSVEHYEQRPSAWVEPTGDWGPGQLRLLEFATELESDDNIALLWQPDQVPGDELRIAYSLTFGSDVEQARFGRVVATRHFTSADSSNGRAARGPSAESSKVRFELDFDVPSAELVRDPVELSLSAPGLRILSQQVERRPGGFRARFELAAEFGSRADPRASTSGSRADPRASTPIPQTELRAFLRSGADVLTETWSYPWQAT